MPSRAVFFKPPSVSLAPATNIYRLFFISMYSYVRSASLSSTPFWPFFFCFCFLSLACSASALAIFSSLTAILISLCDQYSATTIEARHGSVNDVTPACGSLKVHCVLISTSQQLRCAIELLAWHQHSSRHTRPAQAYSRTPHHFDVPCIESCSNRLESNVIFHLVMCPDLVLCPDL